jgi:hypothetical protein
VNFDSFSEKSSLAVLQIHSKPAPSATFFGPSEGHNSAIISAGITAQWTPKIATYVEAKSAATGTLQRP